MKHSHSLRIVTCLLSVLLMGSLLASCGEVPEETSVTTEGIAQTYKAIVCVDDQTFEIADAEGKTVAELLKEANVALKDGDVVSLDMDQVISDGLLIRVLRTGTVSFEILGENGQILEHYTVASTANTVADAMKILGISLAENQELSVRSDSYWCRKAPSAWLCQRAGTSAYTVRPGIQFRSSCRWHRRMRCQTDACSQ